MCVLHFQAVLETFQGTGADTHSIPEDEESLRLLKLYVHRSLKKVEANTRVRRHHADGVVS